MPSPPLPPQFIIIRCQGRLTKLQKAIPYQQAAFCDGNYQQTHQRPIKHPKPPSKYTLRKGGPGKLSTL